MFQQRIIGMHTSIFKIQRGEKQRGYWIAIQVFIVSGSCESVWFTVWYDYKGFVYPGKQQGAIPPKEETELICTVIILLRWSVFESLLY